MKIRFQFFMVYLLLGYFFPVTSHADRKSDCLAVKYNCEGAGNRSWCAAQKKTMFDKGQFCRDVGIDVSPGRTSNSGGKSTASNPTAHKPSGAGTSVQTFLQNPNNCVNVEWRLDSWAQLTTINGCPAQVSVRVKLSNGENRTLYCNANETCKSSQLKSKYNMGFTYCAEYTDYKLKKKYGQCG